MTSSRTFAARNTAVRHNHSTKFCLESTKWQIYFKIGTKKLKINAFKWWKWQHKWYNYMIRSYSFQNFRAFPMACATFETTAQKTLGTLACSAIYNSFSWNASFEYFFNEETEGVLTDTYFYKSPGLAPNLALLTQTYAKVGPLTYITYRSMGGTVSLTASARKPPGFMSFLESFMSFIEHVLCTCTLHMHRHLYFRETLS